MVKGAVIAGLSGGAGKSVVTVGLIAALTKKYGSGRIVPFKKGPDYIDAGWMQLAAKRCCYNLDPYLMEKESLYTSFFGRINGDGVKIAIIEGNRGLYDGVDVDGGYSTAELAMILDLPVILVVNCSKVTRTVAAMVMGMREFDRRVNIVGVILNNIATKRQEKLISEAVEKYTGIPVLGIVPRLKKDIFPMRHLGMLPHQEYGDSKAAICQLAELVEKNIDLEKLEQCMAPCVTQSAASIATQGAGKVPSPSPQTQLKHKQKKTKVRIGILQDAAFQFYYSENLEALEQQGAELVRLSAMEDEKLPPLDGLYIGGGFPETGAAELAANSSFRQSVLVAAEAGMPIYAECGGLIYLGESLEIEGKNYPLVGFFPAQFSMSKKPQAHGYSIFYADGRNENSFYPEGSRVKGHEFRYSKVEKWHGSDNMLSVKMERGTGFWGGRDGLTKKNTFALYTHIHAEGTKEWAELLVKRCREWQSTSKKDVSTR